MQGHASAFAGHSPASDIRFVEVAESVGLGFECLQRDGVVDLISETMGCGVAWLDYDMDGDWDVYAVTGKGRPNALFRNEDGRFADVATEAGVSHLGWGMGVSAADFDGDGWTDLFVTNLHESDVLFRNRGDGTFEDVTETAGIAGTDMDWSTSAAWGDVDADGDLDLYVARYIDFTDPDPGLAAYVVERGEPATLVPHPYAPQGNSLYRNNGNGTFTDVTRWARAEDIKGKGLGAVMGDIDNDGDLDIYVANDVTPNTLFRNRGDGSFDDASFELGVEDSQDGMGVDLADHDNDGDLDLFITNWQTQANSFYRNNLARQDGGRTSATFDLLSYELGLGHTSIGLTGWGTHFSDFDRDGDLDLFVTNGYTSPGPTDRQRCVGQRDQLYRNDDGRFVELPDALPSQDWGAGRGSAVADYDDDGDLDVLVSQNNGRLSLFRNETHDGRHWVKVRAPVGARVELRANGHTYMREITAGSGYLSSGPPEVLFGLPNGTDVVDGIAVRLPDGTSSAATGVPIRRRVIFRRDGPPQVM